MNTDIENLFKDKVLGHPAGLFVLFFTEMWERFSFYGMRVLLVNFLTMAAIGYNPGWEWSVENAGALFGTYAMLLYLTPILGGWIADKYTGYRWAVIIGSLVMTLGHASMALETEFSLYFGLVLLVIGTGFFKPTMTSIISEMYKENPEKKDGAYTIYYMGVNAGAFFGMMLCGYLAEKIGWSYGFGLAGFFMFLGTVQFWLGGSIFGDIGAKPSKDNKSELSQNKIKELDQNIVEEKPNPFTTIDKLLIAISSILGFGYAINDPISKIAKFDIFSKMQIGEFEGQYVAVLVSLAIFIYIGISRIMRYSKVVRGRMFAFIIFTFFTVFFWMSFEQGASSLVIFARDNVDRSLSGNSAIIFNIINTLLTVIPLIIISYILYILWKKTFNKIPASNVVLVLCFIAMWGLVGWMLNRDFNTSAYEVDYNAYKLISVDKNYDPQVNEDNGEIKYHYLPVTQNDIKLASDFNLITKTTQFYKIQLIDKAGNLYFKYRKAIPAYAPFTLAKQSFINKPNEPYSLITKTIEAIAVPVIDYNTNKQLETNDGELIFNYYAFLEKNNKSYKFQIENKKVDISEPYVNYKSGDKKFIINKNNALTEFSFISSDEKLNELKQNGLNLRRDNGIIEAQITKVKKSEVEITVSWFSILNSFFIILFASFFSKWWESKYNPSAATKYALGLIIMSFGFGFLAFGSMGIVEGVKVSMIWLILAYLFHTLGELCLSPVGLSYVSKLVPPRMIALMFGMYYLAVAIGNKSAAVLGGQIENITEQYSLSTFFLIFTIVPLIAGLFVYTLNPLLKKLMHGVN
ncbi:oligopeptide:H+ symporter [Flavobacteriaceae bacterium]|nr:oligopeptide:H+ symporter [Flavobacteriaceae bacterium]